MTRDQRRTRDCKQRSVKEILWTINWQLFLIKNALFGILIISILDLFL